MKKKQQKLLTLFLGRMTKYTAILLVFSCMLMLVVNHAYSLAREIVVDKSLQRLEGGVVMLENEIKKANSIAGILSSSEDYRNLLRVKGMPGSEVYPNITNLQKEISQLCVTLDFSALSYLMFKHSPIFISNLMATDDYHKIYPQFLFHNDLDVTAWRETMMDFSYGNRLISQEQIHISSFYGNSYNGVVCTHNTLQSGSQSGGISQSSVFVTVLDSARIIESFIYADQIEDGFFYIVNQNGDYLLHSNYENQRPLVDIENNGQANVNGESYFIVKAKSHDLGIQAVHGISMNALAADIHALVTTILVFCTAGVIVIILLSLFFSLKEARSIGKIVSMVSLVTEKPFEKNEYAYIDTAFRDLDNTNRHQQARIEKLNSYVRIYALENLLINGCYTAKERNEISQYFGRTFDCFCVVTFALACADESLASEDLLDNGVSLLEDAFAQAMGGRYSFLSLRMSGEEVVFVAFTAEEAEMDMDLIKVQVTQSIYRFNRQEDSKVLLNAGISLQENGAANAQKAYQQARSAIRMNHVPNASGVFLFRPPVEKEIAKGVGTSLLSRCYDIIIAGDKASLIAFFDDVRESVEGAWHDEQEIMQLFFSLRQPVYDAYDVIVVDKKEKPRCLPEFPIYRAGYKRTEILDIFLQYSFCLCDVVATNRKSNNDRLKQRVVDFIKAHFANPELSAAMISEHLLITEKYVFSLVKEATGKSLSKCIENTRLDRAEEYLLTTEYSNASIYPLCGFGSENTFYRAFSKRHGVSPSVWKAARAGILGTQEHADP